MKRLLVLGTFFVILICLFLSGISDTSASIANTNIPDNEVASSVNETENSNSASATIMITWTTAPLPDE